MVLRFLGDILPVFMMQGFCGLLVEEGKFSGGVIATGVLWVAGVVNVLRRV